nr:hypothetical protein B0A51_00227 [Rachicladosporium sp. CCFEE 5018]
MLSSLLLTAAFLTASSIAQFVPASTDLVTKVGYYNQHVRYKEVPEGICELTPGVKSFSGYVDVAPEQSIFFWFFSSRNEDPNTAPLTVWINGGPGSSSMIGLFEELGPLGFSYSKPVSAYVDSSSGSIVTLPDATCPDYATGICGTFSYPNETDTANSTQGAAPSMWKTLQGFMGAFPQYSRNEFNFATESYGGHYGPVFNEYIETQNALIRKGQLPGAHQISLSTPLAALELFERGIGRRDIATGKYDVRRGYITKGTPESDAIYNTTLSAPNPTGNATAKAKRDVRGWKPTRSTQSPLMRRSLGARLGVKPRV